MTCGMCCFKYWFQLDFRLIEDYDVDEAKYIFRRSEVSLISLVIQVKREYALWNRTDAQLFFHGGVQNLQIAFAVEIWKICANTLTISLLARQ